MPRFGYKILAAKEGALAWAAGEGKALSVWHHTSLDEAAISMFAPVCRHRSWRVSMSLYVREALIRNISLLQRLMTQ